MGRAGVTPEAAREIVRTRTTVIGAIMVDRGEADALISGPTGSFHDHLGHIRQLLGLRADAHDCSTLHLLILERGSLFMADTYVSVDLPAEEVAETTLLAAEMVRRFGITPKVALVSHSNFGSLDTASARKMRAGARADPGARAGARGRRRDARRCRAVARDPRAHPAGLDAQRARPTC